jgi:hypothetical protein
MVHQRKNSQGYHYARRTAAQDVTSNLLRRNEALGVRIRQVTFEVCIADHLSQIRASLGMTEQGFGEENNEGFSIITVDLAAKNVEVVGRCPSQKTSAASFLSS